MWDGANRSRAILGLAFAQLRRDRVRSVLVVLGVGVAVLATTLLASTGYGVVGAGEAKFDATGRDLWLTGGPHRFSPAGGGLENSVPNAHRTARALEQRPRIDTAVPMSFQTAYAGADPGNLTTIVGVGVPGDGLGIEMTSGRYFSKGDVHYANGSYDGPWTGEVVLDPLTAQRFDVGVGDQIHLGGTLANARRHRFTVVGVSSAFSGFLGQPSVAVRLSELQSLTGTARTDQATVVALTVVSDADIAAVEASLEHEYPEYDVRTNREQLRAALADRSVLIASGVALVVLAIGFEFALTANLLSQFVAAQRESLAALRAIGISDRRVLTVVTVQGLLLGSVGGLVGALLSLPAASLLNALLSDVFGVSNLLQTPPVALVAAGVIAVSTSTAGAIAAGRYGVRADPLAALQEDV